MSIKLCVLYGNNLDRAFYPLYNLLDSRLSICFIQYLSKYSFYFILFYLILSYFILSYFILHYSYYLIFSHIILSYLILFYLMLFYRILFYLILSYFNINQALGAPTKIASNCSNVGTIAIKFAL